jgi:superoxide dismutase
VLNIIITAVAVKTVFHPHSQSNVENLNKVRRDASRHLRNKKKAYLKAKIKELETNSKIKNVRDCTKASVTSRRGTSLELI